MNKVQSNANAIPPIVDISLSMLVNLFYWFNSKFKKTQISF